jgi:hypothetical protein
MLGLFYFEIAVALPIGIGGAHTTEKRSDYEVKLSVAFLSGQTFFLALGL